MSSLGRKEIPPDDLILKRAGDALRKGHTRASAARLAGIASKTLAEWMRRGAAEQGSRYAAFREKILSIEDEVLTECVGHIRRAGVEDWKAAAWMLTHRFRKEWGDDAGKSTKSEPTKTSSVDDLSLDELNSEIARLEAKLGKADTG